MDGKHNANIHFWFFMYWEKETLQKYFKKDIIK